MASKTDYFHILLRSKGRQQFPSLSSCLDYALEHGDGIQEVCLCPSALSELCEDPPQLGEERDANQDLSPLHHACLRGQQQRVVSLLRENVALVNQLHPPTGSSPLTLACYIGNIRIVKLLLKHRANPKLANEEGLTPLHCCVCSGDVKCIKALLSCLGRGGVEVSDRFGRTPLHWAALKGNVGVMQLLVKKGCSLKAVDNGGRTLLHWALLSQQASCVEYVIEVCVALLSQPDNEGATPLHYAVIVPSSQLPQLLIDKGAVVSESDVSGRAPLLWACVYTLDTALVHYLLSRVHQGSIGSSLVGVVCVGSERACQVLIEHNKTCVSAVDADGYTALHKASRYGHALCVRLLLSAGANVDSLSLANEASLHLACCSGHHSCTEALLNSGANQRLSLDGLWPVHIACSKGYSEVLKVLANHDAGVVDTPLTIDGSTPLHLAASHGHLDCLRALVSAGCDKDATLNNTEMHSALDLAMLGGHSGCADYLYSVGVPSSGGLYHRAALTIQHVWRFHRHKRRMRVRTEWCARVIQRSVRSWLGRRLAARVRRSRARHRQEAATLIQQRWMVYIRQKRRYEATCAQLKTRLHQETLATSLILTQLQLSEKSVCLPAATRQSGPSARYLLMASSNPAPLFPSRSLRFPAKPCPLRALPRQRHPPTFRQSSRQVRRAKKSPPVSEVRLPPVSFLPLTQQDQSVTSRGSPFNNPLSPTEIRAASPIREYAANTPTDQAAGLDSPVSELLLPSVTELPQVPLQPSLVCSVQQESPGRRSFIKLPSQAQLRLARKSTFTPLQLLAPVPASAVPLETGLVSPETVSVREDTPPTVHVSVEPTTKPLGEQELPKEPEEEYREPTVPENEVQTDLDVEPVLLNTVQRYDKLNHILSLLHAAKDEGNKEKEEVKLSRLKEHIMGALDEAVRLRADTQTLTTQVSNQHEKLNT